jgi:dTDP-4-amino-4,6-dideoxygalactose transaminase
MYNDQFGKCPVSQNITEELISLPLHMYLSDDDINYVIEKVIEANKKYN